MAESSTPKKRTSKKANIADVANVAEKVAVSKVSELKNRVTEKAQHLTDDVKKYSAQGTKKVTDSVKKQPLKAIGIAAAVGAVVGLFFRRKKK